MTTQTKAIAPYTKLTELVKEDDTRQKFIDILGPQKGAAFITSLLTVVYNDDNLRDCEPNSVITTALKAAAYDLPLVPELGMAYPVPYYDKKKGCKVCRFQPGYKGFKQLALRTGRYEFLNVAPIFQGEDVNEDRLTGEIQVTGKKQSDQIVGYVGFLKLIDGYRGYTHMTIEQIHAHKEKFSKNWSSGGSTWQTNTAAMEMKTVLLALLREHGVFTFDLTQAVQHDENGVDADQPVIIEPETGEVIDITAREIDPDEIESADANRPETPDDWAKFYAAFQEHFSIEELASVQKQTNNAQVAYDRMREQHP